MTGMPDWLNRSCWPSRSLAFCFFRAVATLRSSPSIGVKAASGQAFGQQRGGDAEQGVADADVLVEVGQRLAGFQRFQPERDLGQFGGHGVDVDAVDAAADDSAQRCPDHGVGRLGLAGFLGGDALGDPAGGGDEEVAGAAGGVADGDVQQRRDSFLGGRVGAGLVEQRVERGVEQALDQRGRRVVGAGLLALVAGAASPACRRAARRRSGGSVPAGTRRRCRVPRRRGCRSRPGASAPPSRGLHQGQGADRAEQGLVGQAGAGERLVERQRRGRRRAGTRRCRRCRAGPARGRRPRCRARRRRAAPPRTGRRAWSPRWRRASWRSRAEEKYAAYRSRASRSLALRRGDRRLSGSGCSSAPRSSATNQNSSRYTSRSSARLKSSSFRSALRGSRRPRSCGLSGWDEEPGAEDGDGLLDAVAELVECPLALLGGEAAPLLQVAGRGAAVALDREPGLVADQVEQHEVGEQLAVEDRLEVELDVGRSRPARSSRAAAAASRRWTGSPTGRRRRG